MSVEPITSHFRGLAWVSGIFISTSLHISKGSKVRDKRDEKFITKSLHPLSHQKQAPESDDIASLTS